MFPYGTSANRTVVAHEHPVDAATMTPLPSSSSSPLSLSDRLCWCSFRLHRSPSASLGNRILTILCRLAAAQVYVNKYKTANVCSVVCVDCVDPAALPSGSQDNPPPGFWNLWRNLLPSGTARVGTIYRNGSLQFSWRWFVIHFANKKNMEIQKNKLEQPVK